MLAGCGGGNSSPYQAGQVGFLENIDRTREISNLSENLAPTETSQMPTGSAEYSGTPLIFETDNILVPDPVMNFLAFGDAEIEISFQSQTVTGRVDNLYEVDAEQLTNAFDGEDFDLTPEDLRTTRIDGQLTLNGADNRVTGSITKANGDTASVSMQTVQVNLLGPNAEVAEVTSFGRSTVDGSAADSFLFINSEKK